MNELIEKLKKNKTAFGLLSPEEQECLKKANEDRAVMLYNYPGKWNVDQQWGFNNPQLTYAIKPDYKPEPVKFDAHNVIHHAGNRVIWHFQEEIDRLTAKLKAKDKALQYAQRLMEWAEKQCHTNCSSGYVPMMPHGDPEPCEWCITKGLIEQALKEPDADNKN